eukprot:718745-Karenia_brevis.AAC.1
MMPQPPGNLGREFIELWEEARTSKKHYEIHVPWLTSTPAWCHIAELLVFGLLVTILDDVVKDAVFSILRQ